MSSDARHAADGENVRRQRIVTAITPAAVSINCSGEIDLTAATVGCIPASETRQSGVQVVVVGNGPIRSVSGASDSVDEHRRAMVTAYLPAASVSRDPRPTDQASPISASLPDSADRAPAGSFAPPAVKRAAGMKELEKVHRLLHGRYHWAIALAVLLGSVGALAGFRFGTKTFRSSGVIRIMPVVPKVMYAVDEKGTIPMYESYVDAQISTLKSQKVTELALDQPEWQQIRQGNRSDEAIKHFAEGIEITRQGELIWVRAVNEDPKVAVAAVNATVNAYLKVYEEREVGAAEKRRELREGLRDKYRIEWDGLRARIQSLATTYGTEDLTAQFQFKQSERNRLETAIRDVQMALVVAKGGQEGPTTAPSIEDADDVAYRYRDTRMVQLLDKQAACEEELAALRERGFGPELTFVKDAQARLSTAKDNVDRHVQKFKQYLELNPVIADRSDARELEARRKALTALFEQANKEMLALGEQELQITGLRERAAEVKGKLDETNLAIEQLNVESQMMGRVFSLGAADRPLGAFRDTRVSTATAGGLAGVALGFGSMILLGLMNARLDRPHDADADFGPVGMLGIVPVLPEDLTDPEHAALAAHCVHEIRTRLQIIGQTRSCPTFGITSPSAGSGKTSLSLALGLSFAAANQKTLLIDCDIVGGGLTRQAEAIVRRRLGGILLRDGIVTDAELEEGLRCSTAAHRRLGQVLVELGYVSQENIERAMSMQQEEALGLLEALEGEEILSCVAGTGIEGLHIMPLGMATVHDAAGLSIAALRGLLDRASNNFDVVIVDTGPILGSLEASVVASQADAVILTIAKGETKAAVEKSIAQLAKVGARPAGLVFNRARDLDVISYSNHKGSSYGQRASSGGAVIEHREVPEARPYGPVARAVASWSPAISIGSKRYRRPVAAEEPVASAG